MSDETLDLSPDADGKFSVRKISLFEEQYCHYVAEGKTKREAYRLAFGPAPSPEAIDQWIHRVKTDRPEILARIEEYRADAAEAFHAKWLVRMEEGLEKMWVVFLVLIDDPKTALVAVRIFQLIGTILGWGPKDGSGQGGSTTNITVNNNANAVAGALSRCDANAKIQKLLELTTATEAGKNGN